MYDFSLKIVKTRQMKYKQKLAKWREDQLFNLTDFHLKNSIKSNTFGFIKTRSSFPSLKKNINRRDILQDTVKDNKRYQEISHVIELNSSQNLMLMSADKVNIGDSDKLSNLNTKKKNILNKVESFIDEEKNALENDESAIANENVVI